MGKIINVIETRKISPLNGAFVTDSSLGERARKYWEMVIDLSVMNILSLPTLVFEQFSYQILESRYATKDNF